MSKQTAFLSSKGNYTSFTVGDKEIRFRVCGYYLYFTAKCIVEACHVHATTLN